MKISKTGNIKQDPINRLYSTEVRAEKLNMNTYKEKEIIETSVVMNVVNILSNSMYKLR